MAVHKSINPFRCRMWELHDRLECDLNERTCRSEIESIARHGQLVPALARPARGDPEYDYELIYGARRLFAARYLNSPLLVDVRDMSDREAIIAMDIENRLRMDISPYERGLSYLRCLRSSHFASQDELARTLKVSASQVSRLLKVARLPSAVLSAFPSATEICEAWGLELATALETPDKRSAILARAREFSSRTPRPPAQLVYEGLLGSNPRMRSAARAARDEVVFDAKGSPLFRIKFRRRSVAILLPADKATRTTLVRIRHALADVLQESNCNADDPVLIPPAKPSRRGSGEFDRELSP